MDLRIESRVKLNNGVEMPVFGLGVWQIPSGRPTQEAVGAALACGYRLIDTAKMYGNERDVGIAIRESGLDREEVFVSTKLWNTDHGYDAAIRAFEESLRRLGTEYVDLYLIHWPVRGLRQETWEALVSLLDREVVRAIGVSNYMVRHVEEVLKTSTVPPAVNQIEFSPFLYQKDLLAYCRDRGIQVEAYSPLTKGVRLNDPTVAAVAKEHDKTPAQVLIRWSLQHGLVVIPKSAQRERILENSQVFDFELGGNDMAVLDGLSAGLHTAWDPTDAL